MRRKGIVTLADIREVQPDLSIWKGDITRLKVGAIVNAANSGMTGCYQPCHNCIDNCISYLCRNSASKLLQSYDDKTEA